MSAPSSRPNAEELILAAFVTDLAQRGRGALDEYARLHPALADEFRALASLDRILDQTRPETATVPHPERLGEFRIVRSVGRGGMGEIYEAVQEPLDRRVAVKTIRHGRISPEARERFLREQQVLARLHQTHIVPIHTAGADGTLHYFAMPFIEGAALHHVVQTALQLETAQSGNKTPTLAKLAGMVTDSKDVPTGPISPPVRSDPIHGVEPPAPLTLSLDYFRSVARVLADAAEAVHHAHGAGVLHRDLKPSNLMVDRFEQCWIIDFGLAACLDRPAADSPARTAVELAPEPITASGLRGTPQYMAPEQWTLGKLNARTDVWGLGATLYELLTLRRAFDGETDDAIRARVLSENPAPPRELASNVPADLAAICLKALRKEPEQRYQTAHQFAEDLRRWLRNEPTQARPAWVGRRVGLWVRRNKGWAAALFATVLALIAVGGAAVHAARLRADAAEKEREVAEEQARDRERALLLMQLQQIRMGIHRNGWFKDVEAKAQEVAKIGKDAVLRDQYAAALAGLDAMPLPGSKTDASSVASSRDGKRWAIGGYTDSDGVAREPAKVWAGGIDLPRESTQRGSGPVAFRAADDAALQLVPDPKDWFTLRLWNIEKNEPVREFRLADKPSPPDWYQRNSLTLALSADGSLVAASTVGRLDGKGTLMVWDVQVDKPIHTVERGFSALAFSPDGALLAAGDREGTVTTWSRKQEKELALLPVGRTAIRCLAFTRDQRRRPSKAPEDGWLLAAGEEGSDITIWDLQKKQLRTRCRGSSHAVYALAFSPDGTILASAGRIEAKLWDAAAGRMLLNLGDRNTMTGLAFSLDGKKLAVTSATAHTHPGGVDVWEIEAGRGIQTLFGLAHRVAQIAISPDDRLLAALDDDWRVGIWDLSSSRLLHVLEVTPGFYTDNAALAFSSNGDRFAFSTGTSAKLWEVATGKEIDSWGLPPGMGDRLAFNLTGKKLLLVRVETEKGVLPPLTNVPWEEHGRVCRAYDLLSPNRAKALVEIKEFKRHLQVWAVAPDAGYFVLEGMPDSTNPFRRVVKAFDGASATNKPLSLIADVERTVAHPRVVLDPSGRLLLLCIHDRNQWICTLFEMPSGAPIRSLKLPTTGSMGPNLSLGTLGCSLYSRDYRARLVTLDVDALISSGTDGSFNAKGTHVAWGNRNGAVTVCDINQVLRQLAELGLGW